MKRYLLVLSILVLASCSHAPETAGADVGCTETLSNLAGGKQRDVSCECTLKKVGGGPAAQDCE